MTSTVFPRATLVLATEPEHLSESPDALCVIARKRLARVSWPDVRNLGFDEALKLCLFWGNFETRWVACLMSAWIIAGTYRNMWNMVYYRNLQLLETVWLKARVSRRAEAGLPSAAA